MFSRNLSLAAVGLMASMALASPISVPNFSFETPVGADGTSTSVEGTIPGSWTSTLFVRVDNPAGTGVGASGQNWTTGIPDGNQVLHMTAAGNPYNVTADQKIPVTFAAGQTYTFTIAVGNSFENDLPQHYALRVFWISGASSDYLMLKTHLTDPVLNGEWRNVTGSYTVQPTDSFIGSGFIDLNLTNGKGYDVTDGQDDVYFDNIRVDVTAVPEPAAMAVSGVGALILAARRSRRMA